MAFNDKEISNQDGRPIALYRLDWGRTSWFYTSADRAVDREEFVNGVLTEVRYEPRAMKDNGMRQGGSSQNDFTLDGPSDLPIVRLFRGTPPSETIWLTVRRMHPGEPDVPIYWKGTVNNVKRPTDATCQIIGKPLVASLKRTGLRLCWTRECPHFLYDWACKVNKADYAVPGEVVAFTGNTVTIAVEEDQEPGWFRGGFIEWPANEDGTIERRMIETDQMTAGDDSDPDDIILPRVTVTVMGLVDFLELGVTATAYPGCTRTPEVCDGKFDNIDNYGGFDKMPGASPFNGPIW